MRFTFTQELDTRDLPELLVGVHRSALLELVRELDRTVADWDFTLALAEHFDGLRSGLAEDRGRRAEPAGVAAPVITHGLVTGAPQTVAVQLTRAQLSALIRACELAPLEDARDGAARVLRDAEELLG